MDSILTIAEQRTNWNVTFPRDAALVKAEAEWDAVRGDRVEGYRPRLTAAEALALSKTLTAEIKARKGAR